MKVSAKTEYACLAMLELAASYGSGQPVQIRRIADRHGIPSRFLVQILLQLKGSGFVNSTRGAAGGYELVRSPRQITLADVVSAIEGPDESSSAVNSDAAAARVLRNCWQEVTAAEKRMLADISLSDLAERVRRQAEPMYYI
ncbi:MAG: Rrf2 family transcriptional regulator [Planctomycetes bacterium]|nr:Rrf2 family transcriptional regulator [Planctomycetota bacterium]